MICNVVLEAMGLSVLYYEGREIESFQRPAERT